VTTPEDYLGTVIGDLNSRRGHVNSMDELHGARVVSAFVPLSEMFGYVGDLRSKTSGQASYVMELRDRGEGTRHPVSRFRPGWFDSRGRVNQNW